MKCILVVPLLLWSLQAGAACVQATDELENMEDARLALTGPDGRSVTLPVRVADDPRERGAGFQHICPETIDDTNIYFVFNRARRPNFHMRNVWAPLDIAFIDADGRIIDIQRMDPYPRGSTKETYYSPPGPVTGAVETRVGFFAEHRITAGDWRVELMQ
jgi:uncharacterized membrane protein (UPF0127 family)